MNVSLSLTNDTLFASTNYSGLWIIPNATFISEANNFLQLSLTPINTIVGYDLFLRLNLGQAPVLATSDDGLLLDDLESLKSTVKYFRGHTGSWTLVTVFRKILPLTLNRCGCFDICSINDSWSRRCLSNFRKSKDDFELLILCIIFYFRPSY